MAKIITLDQGWVSVPVTTALSLPTPLYSMAPPEGSAQVILPAGDIDTATFLWLLPVEL